MAVVTPYEEVDDFNFNLHAEIVRWNIEILANGGANGLFTGRIHLAPPARGTDAQAGKPLIYISAGERLGNIKDATFVPCHAGRQFNYIAHFRSVVVMKWMLTGPGAQDHVPAAGTGEYNVIYREGRRYASRLEEWLEIHGLNADPADDSTGYCSLVSVETTQPLLPEDVPDEGGQFGWVLTILGERQVSRLLAYGTSGAF